MGKTICITGVSGFIGKALAKRCQLEGFTVKGLDINTKPFEELNASGIETLRGDITSPTACESAFLNCDIVVHTAAVTDPDADKTTFRPINVGGTRTALEAAEKMQVKKFVHLSSISVYGFEFPEDADESTPMQGERDPYCVSKIRAEKAVNDFQNTSTMEIITLRPGEVYGDESRDWVREPLRLMKRKQFYIPTKNNWTFNGIFIENLLDALVSVIKSTPPSRIYNLVDDNPISVTDFFQKLGTATGAARPKRRPLFLIKLKSLLFSLFSLSGGNASITKNRLRMMAREGTLSNAKAKKELGFSPGVDLDLGLSKIGRRLSDKANDSDTPPGN